MYFSMHWVTQVFSPLVMELPGLGTHLSKQFSLIFCKVQELTVSLRCIEEVKRDGIGNEIETAIEARKYGNTRRKLICTYFDEVARVLDVGLEDDLLDDGFFY